MAVQYSRLSLFQFCSVHLAFQSEGQNTVLYTYFGVPIYFHAYDNIYSLDIKVSPVVIYILHFILHYYFLLMPPIKVMQL